MVAHCLVFTKKRIVAMMLMQLPFLVVKICNINLLSAVTKLFYKFAVYPPAVNMLLKKNLPILKIRRELARKLLRKSRVTWYHPGRTDNWWQNMCNNILPAEEWKKNFRLSCHEFQSINRQNKTLSSIRPKFSQLSSNRCP